MKNTECSIIKIRAPAINLRVDVLLYHSAPLHFILLPALQTLEATFQAKNNVRSAPVSTSASLMPKP